MESHILTINVSSLRYVDVNGRRFAIAPMTILEPKVLEGSKGKLFYPVEEIAKTVDEWNGKPLTVRHPKRNGANVSAFAPDIFINQEIGRFYKSTLNKDGSNSGEGWFDVELTKKLHSELWNRLERGEKVEVSTGLYTDNEEAPKGSHHDGKDYDYIARNYKPNHIAILPDEVGACSIKDGCGVFNSEKNQVNNPASVKDHDKWEKAKEQASKEGHSEDYAYITGIYKQMGGTFNADCGTGAGGFKPGNDCAKGGEGGYKNEFSYQKDLLGHSTPEERLEKWKGFGTIYGQQLRAYQDSINKKAHIYLAPAEIKELQDKGYLTSGKKPKITDLGKKEIYKSQDAENDDIERELRETGQLTDNKGGTSNEESEDDSNDQITCAYCGTIQNKPDDGICPNCLKTVDYIPNTRDAIMNRQVIIDWLTTNCACYKNADGKKKLESFNDAALKEILIENAEKGVESDSDQTFLEWIGNADKEIKNAFVSMIRKKLKTAVGSANEFPIKKDTPQKGTETDTSGGDTDTAKAAAEEEMKKKMAAQTANNTASNQPQLTIADIQKAIFEHPTFKNMIANHNQNENTEKQKLIGQITSTITDANYKTQVVNTLSQKSIDDLRLIASLTPQTQPQLQPFNPVANYFGASGGPAEITDNNYLQQEKLVVNEIDWAAWSKEQSKVA